MDPNDWVDDELKKYKNYYKYKIEGFVDRIVRPGDNIKDSTGLIFIVQDVEY